VPRILLIDDDEMSRQAVQRMLERAGFTVMSTGDGREAIDGYHAGEIDLVITDLIMPDIDGLEIIQEIRRKDPAAKILAISGGGRVQAEEYLSVARKFGAVEVLPKPFASQDLKAAVDRALGGGKMGSDSN
jgi:two-component system chemotaxis response regulator CheY